MGGGRYAVGGAWWWCEVMFVGVEVGTGAALKVSRGGGLEGRLC